MAESSVPQLRYVAAVARTGSFSAAARACRVTQPTVSAAVAELERRVGASLFRRSARGVELTPAGREVLPQIESVLGALSDLDRAVETLRSPARKLLRLAFSPVLDPRTLSAVGDRFRADHPEVEIVYKECTTDDIRLRVEKGTVDVCSRRGSPATTAGPAPASTPTGSGTCLAAASAAIGGGR